MTTSHTVRVCVLRADGLEKFLGHREVSILQCMWKVQRLPSKDGLGWTVTEIRHRLQLDGVDLSATSVQTTMNRMHIKGLLHRVKMPPDATGTAYFYSPTISEKGLERLAVFQVLDDLVEDFSDLVDEYLAKERRI